MGEAMQDYLTASGLGRKLRDWPVHDAWRSAAGEALARRARPVAYRHGVLTVEVDSAAHLQELKGFTGDQYRVLANRNLGREEISQVRSRSRPCQYSSGYRSQSFRIASLSSSSIPTLPNRYPCSPKRMASDAQESLDTEGARCRELSRIDSLVARGDVAPLAREGKAARPAASKAAKRRSR